MFVKVIYLKDVSKQERFNHLVHCQSVSQCLDEETGSICLTCEDDLGGPMRQFMIPKDGTCEVYFMNELGQTIDRLIFN